MTGPRDWSDDRLEREVEAWLGARPAPPAPATLRAFAAEVASRPRATPLAGRRSVAWRGGPASRLAVAATIVAAIAVTGGLLLISGRPGPAAPTASPVVSPPVSAPPSPAGSSPSPAPTGSSPVAPSAPTPIDDGGTFGGSGLWATRGETLYLSTDRGATWTERTLPAGVALDVASGDVLSSVFVLDASHIWTATPGPGSTVPYGGQGPNIDHLHVVISRSVDGGATWQSVAIPGDWGGTQPVLSFANKQDGFLLLAGLRFGPGTSTVFATADGGAAWQRVGGSAGLGSVFGASGPSLWAGNQGDAGPLGRPVLDVSRDGGRTWTDAALPGLVGDTFVDDNPIAPPAFSGQEGALAVVAGSADDPPDVRFYRSVDGGQTWRLVARQPLPDNGSRGVAVIDPTHFVVIDSGTGEMAETADGGVTWQPAAASGLGATMRLMFWDPRNGAAIEQLANDGAPAAGLLHTADGGQTWTPIILPSPSPSAAPPASLEAPSAAPAVAVPACDPQALAASGGRSGEAGVVQLGVLFTNRGPAPCSLPSVPAGVTLIRSDGTALDLQTEPPQGGPTSRVVLRPGVDGDAGLTAYWTNWCGKDPGPLDVRVTLTAGGGSVETPLVGPLVARCDAPSAPSTIQIDRIVSGSGQAPPWWAAPAVSFCVVAAQYRIDDGQPAGLGNCAAMLFTTPGSVTVRVGQEIDLHMTARPPVGTSPAVPIFPLPISPDDRILQLIAQEDDETTGRYLAVAPGEVILATTGLCTDVRTSRQSHGVCPVLDVTVMP